MTKNGVVCGRFQIFHYEHLQYVLAAAQRCEHLIIGVTSPDNTVSPKEKADLNRGKKESNPCTYYERMKMIENVMNEVGVSSDFFDIVPFPIGKPEILSCYIPQDVCIFLTILDDWGYCKKERLERHGYAVQILWEKKEKKISSTMIRHCIAAGREWRQYVPNATYQFVLDNKIDIRIRHLLNEGAV